mmetsp:Transcript_19035/g.59065  ORF Transcript_19035/g.59065 Transcript_19035/m.59065 type:complete len:249 (-) Transcript_19035:64-810(-)
MRRRAPNQVRGKTNRRNREINRVVCRVSNASREDTPSEVNQICSARMGPLLCFFLRCRRLRQALKLQEHRPSVLRRPPQKTTTGRARNTRGKALRWRHRPIAALAKSRKCCWALRAARRATTDSPGAVRVAFVATTTQPAATKLPGNVVCRGGANRPAQTTPSKMPHSVAGSCSWGSAREDGTGARASTRAGRRATTAARAARKALRGPSRNLRPRAGCCPCAREPGRGAAARNEAAIRPPVNAEVPG